MSIHHNGKTSSEDVDQAIDKIAKFVVEKYDLGLPVSFLLESTISLGRVYGELGYFYLSPFLKFYGVSDESSNKYLSIFSEQQNLRRLISRIKELSENRDYKPVDGEKASIFEIIRLWLKRFWS